MKIRTKKQLELRSNQPVWNWDGHQSASLYYLYLTIAEGTILDVEFETSTYYVVKINGIQYSIDKYDAEKINKKVDNNINTTMNIKEKFVLAITPEPKKSFRKAKITDGDDVLTDEGTKVFLTWMLHNKFAEEFKKDVVDGILKEKEEDAK